MRNKQGQTETVAQMKKINNMYPQLGKRKKKERKGRETETNNLQIRFVDLIRYFHN